MSELHELVWKTRFAARLAQLFVLRGLTAHEALSDAEAHADEHYPKRMSGAPELEADDVYRDLWTDSFGYGEN
jgi:hypothetical protein